MTAEEVRRAPVPGAPVPEAVAVGESPSLRIDSLGSGGEGVGRSDGLVVFVPGTAPGDRVRARLTRVKRSFAQGELLEVLEPGAVRREPPCPYAGSCGGCSWLHVDPGEQRRARREILLQALRRIGHLEQLPEVDELPSPVSLGYRTRARVAWEAGRVGFRARGSHRVVDVERCAVLDPATAAELERLRRNPPPGQGEREIRGFGEEVELGGRSLRVRAGGFFQANGALWEAWRAAVLDACGSGALALELYAGVGFYTAGLDERFRRVVAVERGAAAEDLRANSGAEVVQASAEAWAVRDGVEPGTELVLLNPPREGCHISVLEALREARVPRIVYVSCDAATLARDIGALRHEYRVIRVCSIEALPQTHHVEALCVLELT